MPLNESGVIMIEEMSGASAGAANVIFSPSDYFGRQFSGDYLIFGASRVLPF
jgi:hypothetical protein